MLFAFSVNTREMFLNFAFIGLFSGPPDEV
jgi:hypothetical protein